MTEEFSPDYSYALIAGFKDGSVCEYAVESAEPELRRVLAEHMAAMFPQQDILHWDLGKDLGSLLIRDTTWGKAGDERPFVADMFADNTFRSEAELCSRSPQTAFVHCINAIIENIMEYEKKEKGLL